MSINETPYTRARSFMERYIIERASQFRVGHEEEDAWACALAAKNIFRNIANVARDAEPEVTQSQGPFNAGNSTGHGPSGAHRQGGLVGAPVNFPVPLGSANKAAWLAAGRDCIIQAMKHLHDKLITPPAPLMEAWHELHMQPTKGATNGKTTRK